MQILTDSVQELVNLVWLVAWSRRDLCGRLRQEAIHSFQAVTLHLLDQPLAAETQGPSRLLLVVAAGS